MKKTKSAESEIVFVVKKRAEKALEKFRTEAVFGVYDPELLTILREVLSYWKDSNRPALTFRFVVELCLEEKPEIADDAGLIFVFAAAATGIHDDIIDKSLKNHFRWTVFGLYGLEKALLVGDLLFGEGVVYAKRLC